MVQVASESESSALATPEQVNERLRQFWRVRRHAEPQEITFADQYVDQPEVMPINSTKTFVGRNGTYYDERWRFMEWRSKHRSWNWAAALSFGGWLAYRRMYMEAAAFVVLLGLLVALAVNGVSISLVVAAQAAVLFALGSYGNLLYMRRFRSAALQAAQSDGQHKDRLAALARAGGTSRLGPFVMGVGALATAGAAALVTSWARGTLTFSY